MAIGISATPDILIEEEGTILTVTLTSSEPIPDGGLVVSVDSNLENALRQFNVFGARFDNAQLVGTNNDLSGLDVRLLEQTATLTLPIANDDVPDRVDDFTFTVLPGEGYTVDPNASSVTLVIEDAESPPPQPTNTPPVVQNDSYNIQSGGMLNIDAASGVLANDSDVDETDQLTASVADAPDNGSLTLNSDGSFAYTPNNGFSGIDSFTYTVNDGEVDSQQATVEITVQAPPQPTNTPAVVQNDSYNIQSGGMLNIDAASGVLANDSDVDEADQLTASVADAPDNGSLTLNSDGSFAYTPNNGFSGIDSFTYTVNDGEVDSQQATVEITVEAPPEPANNPPVAQNDSYNIQSGGILNIDVASGVLANDSDVDETDQLTASVADAPDNGSLTLNSDGSFAYTPNDGFSGIDSFTYTVNDGEVDSQQATVEITVEAPSQPEFQASSEGSEIVKIAFSVNESDAIDGLIFDTTPAGDGVDITTKLADDVLDLGTDAAFDNLIGLYEIVDANGGIDTDGDGVADFLPGQDGYAQAAIENRVEDFVVRAGSSGDENQNTTAEEFGDVILEGGRLYSTFAIANGGELGFDGFIEKENGESSEFNNAAEFTSDAVAYFGFTEANPDGIAHFKSFGNNIFGFEDLAGNLGNSDNDFNDAVFKLDFSLG